MKTVLRAVVLLPVLLLALVAIPSYVIQALAANGDGAIAVWQGAAPLDRTKPMSGTVPTPTPVNGTVPTATPVNGTVPTPTPQPRSSAHFFSVSGHKIIRVIGDRLSQTIYGLADNGWLYRSNNDGRTWALATTAPLVRKFIMNAGNPYVLYGGAGLDCAVPSDNIAPLYRSDDGGVTWVMQPTGRNLRPLLTDPGNPARVFAADCAMLFLSTDGGSSWAAKPDLSATQLWDHYTVVDMSAAALVGDPRPEQPTWDQLFALGVDAAAGGAVAFTGETGDSWVEITNLEQAPLAPVAVVAHLTQAGRIWVVAADGVWTTANFGVNWEFSGDGLPSGLYNGGLNDLTYGPDGMLYLATDLGLYILPPGESVWQVMDVEGAGRRSMESLLLTETNPGQLWVNTDDGVFLTFVSQ
ncbi:MAG: hypothetical protein KA259_03350 [Caldilineaceae bacterium]|nr:hypothetical protein [Caldilineaceae bacterium]